MIQQCDYFAENYHIMRIVTLMLATAALSVSAQSGVDFKPEIHGTVRAKYEYEPSIDKGRFEVRNARLSFEGNVVDPVRYKAEIDLSDEGVIKMLDAYVRLQPNKTFKFTIGQMRVPFTIDAHRSPHLQYFANRSFIAKQVGNVRDVGATAAWTSNTSTPLTLEGGIFNGSGLTNQKNFWTSSYNFSLKAQMLVSKNYNVTLSCQKSHAGSADVMMWCGGGYVEAGRWHVEGEYLRKNYMKDAFAGVNSVDAFAAYRIPFSKCCISGLSLLGRYDYMSDHANGSKESDGKLSLTDPARHRATWGVTVSLGSKALQADVRLNCENYFYAENVAKPLSEQSKIVMEFVAHF